MPLPSNFFPSAVADMQARGVDFSRDNPWALALSAFPKAQQISPGITMEQLVTDASNFLAGPTGRQPQQIPPALKALERPEIFTPEGPMPDPMGMGGPAALDAASANPNAPTDVSGTLGHIAAMDAVSGLLSGVNTGRQAISGAMMASPQVGQTLASSPSLLSALAAMGPAGTTMNMGAKLSGMAAGMNQVNGMPMADAKAVLSDPQLTPAMFDSIMNAPITTPAVRLQAALSAMGLPGNIQAMSPNEAGFNVSPMSLGTPFGSNAPNVDSSQRTNFSPQRSGQDEPGPDGTGPPGGTGGGGNEGPAGPDSGGGVGPGAAGGTGGTEGTPGSGGPPGVSDGPMKKGGIVKDTKKGGGDNEPRKLTAGEFVVNKKATGKHRQLLEALNAITPYDGMGMDKLMGRAQDFFHGRKEKR